MRKERAAAHRTTSAKVLFCKDKLAFGGDAQNVALALMDNIDLVATTHQIAHVHFGHRTRG